MEQKYTQQLLKRCPQCQVEAATGLTHCPRCGADLNAPPTPASLWQRAIQSEGVKVGAVVVLIIIWQIFKHWPF